jgi:beta-lactam-binding protein with PASTA domain
MSASIVYSHWWRKVPSMKLFLAHHSLLTLPGLSGALVCGMVLCGCGERGHVTAEPPTTPAIASPALVASPTADRENNPARKQPATQALVVAQVPSHSDPAPVADTPTSPQPPTRPPSNLPAGSENRQLNLRMLGEALRRYVIDNEGRLPAHLSELYKQGLVMDLSVFSLPSGGTRIMGESQIDTLTDYEMLAKLTNERPLLVFREKVGPRNGLPLAFYSDRTIRTVERSAQGELAVPSVIGLDTKDAKEKLSKVGYKNLRFVIANQSASTRERELTVQGQTPSAGSAVSSQTQIVLTIYPPGGEPSEQSPAGAAVPSVVGLKAAEAKARMLEAGFRVLFVSSDQPAPTKEEELTIQRHTPAAGAAAPKGTQVTLIVYPKGAETADTTSAGDKIEVPRVIGLDVKDAKALLESKGAKIRLESADTPPTRDQAFTIEAQAPEAGKKIRRGTTVVLRVYSASKP